ncbi:hypothetical protein CY35_03G035100, partial [Sphagnum magellanicum]
MGGEYVIRNNEPGKKLGVWEAFSIVYDRSNVKLDYAACNTGTTTISKHKCHVPASEVAVAKVFFKKHIITKQEKETMTAAAADYCLLANPTTVSRNIDSRAWNGREKLTLVLKKHFDSGLNVACTLDLWMDAIIVVSDSDSNCCGVNGIPSAFYWLACLDHKLATVLTTVVNKTTKMENGVRSKPFYRYKDVQHMLPLFMMIDACKKAGREMYDELVPLLQMKDKLSKLNDISRALLKELITFLAPFQQATLALEKFKHPTLHKVLWWCHVILGHLRLVLSDVVDEDGNVTMVKDSDSIKAIKGIMLLLLYSKFVFDDIHVMASLLDLIMKSRLVHLGDKLKDAMIKYAPLDDEEEDVRPAQSLVGKKARSLVLMYDQMLDDDDEEDNVPPTKGHDAAAALNARVDNEYEANMKHKVTDGEMRQCIDGDASDEFHVLSWWRRKGKDLFPILARVVAMSNNNFSDADNTLTKKRNRLKPRTINNLMCHGWVQLTHAQLWVGYGYSSLPL